ncbi:hypothetical protein BD626DRAFT_464000 [Schizophyllum amplum]|uniref:Coronin n=1 Tax=Schizophyllum amplum TaxID=97359 RepID=A0A550C009_9AGAR|nr:hypothetical protein BD626DRAFT_464000 [Auriculariopsis ampla]
MSRFVRASKYRHVFGQGTNKKELIIENVKVTNNAWDTNIIAASGAYLSVNWNASGGGAFAILPLPSPFSMIPDFPNKLPDTLPLARSHTAPVLDTDWSPHNDAVVASGGDDGRLCIWKVDAADFEGWGAEGWVPRDFDPVARIDASAKKVGQVLWHPTASNVVASASGEHVVKLWDLGAPETPRSTLAGHNDAIQSLSFNAAGTLLATTCRDRKLRIFDPRAGPEPVRVTDGHGGIKGSRVVWMGEMDRIATTGFSKMSDRQVSLWETGSLKNLKTMVIDQSSGVMMPFWSDNNILFLAGKGDGNVRYYEYENDALYGLDEFKSSEPQRGMCFIPRRALNIAECEIARAYKIHGSSIEPIPFRVPRKADSFQSDIYPPALSTEPALTAAEFFAGKTVPPKLVDLASGTSFTSPVSPPPVSGSASAPIPSAPAAVPTPTRTFTAPAPEPAPAPAPVRAPSPPAPTPTRAEPSRAESSGELSQLKDSNAALAAELREAREKIRNLELQLETQKANARKAAAALLEG